MNTKYNLVALVCGICSEETTFYFLLNYFMSVNFVTAIDLQLALKTDTKFYYVVLLSNVPSVENVKSDLSFSHTFTY